MCCMALAVVLDLRPTLSHQPGRAVGELGESQRRPCDLGTLCDMPIVAPEEVEFQVEPIAI